MFMVMLSMMAMTMITLLLFVDDADVTTVVVGGVDGCGVTTTAATAGVVYCHDVDGVDAGG